jgi:hypothetical protein
VLDKIAAPRAFQAGVRLENVDHAHDRTP